MLFYEIGIGRYRERHLLRVALHQYRSGVCSLMTPQQMPFECSQRDHILFSFLLKINFHLPICTSQFLEYFFNYIYRSYVPICWIDFSRRIDSCYTLLCSMHHYFFSCFCLRLMCLYVFYMRYHDVYSKQLLQQQIKHDIHTSLFYLSIFLSLLCIE